MRFIKKFENYLFEAKPNISFKNKTYYHGTHNLNIVKNILLKGIIPQNLSTNRYGFNPLKGCVYITELLEEALGYVYSGYNKDSDNYGYIIEIEGSELKNIFPDEDVIWRCLNDFSYIKNPNKKDMILFFNNIKKKYNLEYREISYEDAKKLIFKMTDNEILFIINNLYIQYADEKKPRKTSIANKGIVYPNKIWRFDKNKNTLTHFNKTKELLFKKRKV